MIKLYYICSLKSSIFLNFFKLDNQFFCRSLKYIILRRKKLDKIILYKFYLILINLIYLLLITAKLIKNNDTKYTQVKITRTSNPYEVIYQGKYIDDITPYVVKKGNYHVAITAKHGLTESEVYFYFKNN